MEEVLLHGLARPSSEDLQAWIGELFDRHQARLYRLALRMSRDAEEARDLVQEAFLRAASRAGSIPRQGAGAEAWLVRVMVNLCRDRYRRRRTRPADAGDGRAERGHDPRPALLTSSLVQAAVASLAPRRRAVVVLHELEERPVAEVARMLGISAVTVRWHLSRARHELRRWLGSPPYGAST